MDTSGVPFRITDEAYVAAERYYDPDFFRLENERLWPRVWQPACRLDEIPDPGDFTEYRILDQSVLLIRQPDRSVKAFYNACRHRGTALGLGSGSFPAGQIVCPFHGWRYNLDGSNAYIYAKEAFRPDCVEDPDVELKPIKVGEKFGMVWINFDEDAPPFESNFPGVAVALDPQRLDLMHVTWWHQVEFEANWKTTQEAYLEGYHLMQTHPEMAMFLRDEDFKINMRFECEGPHAWVKPVGHYSKQSTPGSKHGSKMYSASQHFHASEKVMWEGARAYTTKRRVEILEDILARGLPDERFFEEYYRRVYEEAAANNVPVPRLQPHMTNVFGIFPNFLGLATLGTALVFRPRPHPKDPNKCVFDVWALEIPPDGTPVTRPVKGRGPTLDELWFIRQDFGNIERMQVGLRTMGHKVNRLSLDFERTIVNWHSALDRFLAS
jgi:phenylpropionate dioxygenase-like ring-hydroxylating dioxygenase large terminal subunit